MSPCDEIRTDIMASMLSEIGFESFVPDNEGLTAYIKAEIFDLDKITDTVANFPIPTDTTVNNTLIEGQDWNAEWEKNYFKPIVIGNRCVIHSSFHTDIPDAEYRIVIDPRMAFGTGHHSTTSLMIGRILSTDLSGKKVIDMGTGTGILAILCLMRGAAQVTGIEIDPMAQANAVDNTILNNAEAVTMLTGDASLLSEIYKADIFLANINRNIITADIERYADACAPGANLFLSGFYNEDVPVIIDAATRAGFKFDDVTLDNNWACVKLTKS